MVPAGLLGDRFGRKKVMLIALAFFGLGSAACAYAPSSAAFIEARALLGLAGAGIIVMALSALTVLFTEKERPRAVGVWAAANFLALPIGPILGGWLLTNYWWGWVFLINVPVALVGLLVALALVPESRASVRPGLDPVGVVVSIAGLVGGRRTGSGGGKDAGGARRRARGRRYAHRRHHGRGIQWRLHRGVDGRRRRRDGAYPGDGGLWGALRAFTGAQWGRVRRDAGA